MYISTKEIGKLGENIGSQFLINYGFKIIERNYLKKWGEIDIVAAQKDRVHFVEVKTVSHETRQDLEFAVSRGTWRSEEQVHSFKMHQIHKAIQTWIEEHKYTGEFQIDVLAIRVVPRETFATVNYLENVITD
jgi:putative endonuclease